MASEFEKWKINFIGKVWYLILYKHPYFYPLIERGGGKKISIV